MGMIKEQGIEEQQKQDYLFKLISKTRIATSTPQETNEYITGFKEGYNTSLRDVKQLIEKKIRS